MELTQEQREEIAKRFASGETQDSLATAFKTTSATIRKWCRKLGGVRPVPVPERNLTEFSKRARSILWRQDSGPEEKRKTYLAWKSRVEELSSPDGGGFTKNQAIVVASKTYPCLRILFREYDVREFDPEPESTPDIRRFSQPISVGLVVSDGKEQSHRENLNWAMNAAGEYLRTGKSPITCPNDLAYYLFEQAKNEPKDFLSRFNQIEGKGDSESEEKRSIRRSGMRSINEIDSMLSELSLEGEDG